MRTTFGCAVIFSVLFATAGASFALTFSDVDVSAWAQSSPGADQNAAMTVISFPDGSNFAFGYRWNAGDVVARPPSTYASAYGANAAADKAEAMLLALDAQTPLSVTVNYHDLFGFAAEGFAYDGHPLATDGWATSFPGYWNSGAPGYTDWTGTTYPAWDGDGETWQASGLGASSRGLRDGDWDGWTKEYTANGFDPQTPPVVPIAEAVVPEPATLMLIGLGATALLGRWRARRA